MLLQDVVQQLLQTGVQGHHRQGVLLVNQALHDHASQPRAHQRGQLVRVLGSGADLGERLNNGAHVAYRHAVIEQALQGSGQGPQGQFGRDQVFNQLGRLGNEFVQQLLDFVMAKQIRGVFAQHFVQMGGHRCGGIDHRVAQSPGMVTLRRLNPHRIQAKGGFLRGRAL